ncbi:MAG: ATP-binding cassette domain-containing protein [Cyclobacteriaceae bacterium]|nr:ATP-binding cassette domain-containing protein [Cyclobacteriaceae bacterium]
MELLEVKNITKTYSTHTALRNVSISIPKQSIFGLLGPNGAGKTTLIRIINQIINADTGSICINGENLNANHIKMIGYLPEERGLYKKMKVGEQLVYLGQLRGLSRKKAVIQGKHWCKKLEIFDWWSKKVEDLSKGMAQKIQFISTIMHEPELIILDEPFSGFDPVNANLIKDEILELRDQGATVIFSTHRMESVEQLCDHIAMIDNAEKILDGTKKDIKNSYKTNTYQVEHDGDIQLTESIYEVISQGKSENDNVLSSIKIKNNSSSNELLSELIKHTEVHSFAEKIPSINDIFIAKVKGGGNE